MKHLAAYLLLTLGGNESPSAKDITGVLSAVGIEADEERVKTLLSELKDKDINELIAEGSSKLASVPSGGAGGAAAAGGAAGRRRRRKSPTRTWVSVCSTKRSAHDSYGNDDKENREEDGTKLASSLFFFHREKAISWFFGYCATETALLELFGLEVYDESESIFRNVAAAAAGHRETCDVSSSTTWVVLQA
ncbi:60S acidic ribosomal protein P2 [Beauveria bassiana D1-5]|uniref:60S acidic ribosomal protein P2 n=1 Tax=Beauveria bassiana D1-5 TaxID=1245745 RepID=A0A0A2W3V9_BEABA|nr:60S acidic ribosomal protein P2 [Beauveria bassiana D1-5]